MIGVDSAFRRSGRFKVNVATPAAAELNEFLFHVFLSPGLTCWRLYQDTTERRTPRQLASGDKCFPVAKESLECGDFKKRPRAKRF